MVIKIIRLMVALSMVWGAPANALDMSVLNDVDDIVRSQQITLRIGFDTDEQAILRDTLRFSVNASCLELKGWKTEAAALTMYLTQFKKNKRVIAEPFNASVFIDIIDPKGVVGKLSAADIYCSALMVTIQSELKAVHATASLSGNVDVLLSEAQTIPSLDDIVNFSSVSTTTLLPHQRSFTMFQQAKNSVKLGESSELIVIDRLKDLEHAIIDACLLTRDVVQGRMFLLFFLTIFLFFCVIGWFSYKRYRVIHTLIWQGCIFSIFITLFATMWLLRFTIGYSICFFSLSILSFCGALYYSWVDDNSFGSRVSLLVGTICALCILPFLIHALLYDHCRFLISLFS